jgi:hypothetical protein
MKWLLAIVCFPAAAQNCLHSGEGSTLEGLLNTPQAPGTWTLRLDHSACIGTNPLSHAKEFRVLADQDAEGTTYWLDQLSGGRVSIAGQIELGKAAGASTLPVITVRWVEPAKGTSHRSYIPWSETRILFKPRPIRGLAPRSYEVLVLTGKTLVVEARDTGSRGFLMPARDYMTYGIDSARELWIGCGDGYRFMEGGSHRPFPESVTAINVTYRGRAKRPPR